MNQQISSQEETKDELSIKSNAANTTDESTYRKDDTDYTKYLRGRIVGLKEKATKIKRPSNLDKIIASVGDGISAFANLYYTSKGSPNMNTNGLLSQNIKSSEEKAESAMSKYLKEEQNLQEKLAKEDDRLIREKKREQMRSERKKLIEHAGELRKADEEKREKAERNRNGIFSEEDLEDYELTDNNYDIKMTGFMGKPGDKNNSFFITNNSDTNYDFIEIELSYEDAKGRTLDKQTIRQNINLKGKETIQMTIPNWDRSGRAVYYLDEIYFNKHNSNFPYRVVCSKIRCGKKRNKQ